MLFRSSAASAVDAALRYYCTEWAVIFPTQRNMAFDERIERILSDARRPSYRSIDVKGIVDLLYLYRSRNAMHEGDCFYRDDSTGTDVYCEMSHARRFFNVAQTFAYWLDSQA